MTKDEAIQTLSKIGKISVAYAEDLYDSFLPKPVIPYYIADYLEKVKSEGDLTVVGAVNEAPEGRVGDWLILENVNTFAQAWVNGYTVAGEPRYTVRFNNFKAIESYLKKDLVKQKYYLGDKSTSRSIVLTHTRKELEDAGFGWIFDCEGIEIEEVDDGND